MSKEGKENQPEDGVDSSAGSGFVERETLLGTIHRQLNFSLFGLSLLAIPIGVVCAYGAWGFLEAFGLLGNWLVDTIDITSGTMHILALGVGGLFFGIFLHLAKWQRFMNPAHVIVAASENGGRIRARDGIATAVADAIALALAAPVGRYGPTVYLGASIGSLCAQLLRMGETSIRILLGCGVAAAISASFNAPIAGVLFAHEVIIGHFKLRAFAPITLASVSAVAIARYHHFEYVALKLWKGPHEIVPLDYLAYLIFGFVTALVAMVYMSGIMGVSKLAERIRLPKWSQPMLGGVIAGTVALWMPEILGLGDSVLQAVLEQDLDSPRFGLTVMLALGGAKLVASVFALGLRYPGGAFTPAMFVGAMLGGFFGMLVPSLDYQISVMVGMGAMVGAVVGAPLSVILIVFELTENYEAATAVMVAVVVGNAFVTRYFARSLFHRQIRVWGIEIERPPEQKIMSKHQVGGLMRKRFFTISTDESIADLRELMRKNPGRTICVVDSTGNLVGVLPEIELETLNGEIPINELVKEPCAILAQDDTAWVGFETLENSETDYVPVVESSDSRQIVGIAKHSDFLAAYRRAVQESRKLV